MGTQDKENENKKHNTTEYVLDTTIPRKTQDK